MSSGPRNGPGGLLDKIASGSHDRTTKWLGESTGYLGRHYARADQKSEEGLCIMGLFRETVSKINVLDHPEL